MSQEALSHLNAPYRAYALLPANERVCARLRPRIRLRRILRPGVDLV